MIAWAASAEARELADYFIENLPGDRVPPWDFDVADPSIEPKDSSAAAIAASGLIELSELVEAGEASEGYYGEATAILESLGSQEYLALGTESSGILLHATAGLPSRGREAD